LGNSFSILVFNAQVELSFSVTLTGRFQKPPNRFGIILLHADAFLIHFRQMALGHSIAPVAYFYQIIHSGRVALFNSPSVPFGRFRFIPGDAFPFFVLDTQIKLGAGISMLGRF